MTYAPPRALRHAIEAAEAWVNCPCEEHRKACWEIVGPGPLLPLWSTAPATMAAHGTDKLTQLPGAAVEAAGVIGEQTVREAICTALIEWCHAG